MVVDGRNKNQNDLFHFLSGARAAPGVGQLGKGKMPFQKILADRFSAENDYGTVHIFELLTKIS